MLNSKTWSTASTVGKDVDILMSMLYFSWCICWCWWQPWWKRAWDQHISPFLLLSMIRICQVSSKSRILLDNSAAVKEELFWKKRNHPIINHNNKSSKRNVWKILPSSQISNFCWISILYKLTKKQISNMYEMSFTQTRNPFIGELWPSFSSYFKYVAIVSFLFSFRLCFCPLVLVGSYFRPKDGKYMSLIGLKTRERNVAKGTLDPRHWVL